MTHHSTTQKTCQVSVTPRVQVRGSAIFLLLIAKQ